ncbi:MULTISPECIES: GumC family protein [Bacteroidales]|uniref:GumC family protein n=1 Tax=Bacteroidales TaxID=171549 RepID=UPI001897E52A|nr:MULTISPECIES: polysaccharide biosynthesis tyrosine autokinase [Bacteroidales]MDB9117018.1 polysaccharide biosynthesis tyrosine autokinase [Parabacteroides merdae]MDB9189453.1 polysaccharide biosynthesis tyrosine autokinase [Parabacteroides distasonis]MDB9199133.1 polysaccharide biosynthesis tyrosine autokinase [Parabacteroides distasonis]MDC1721924.1 polysaccharide biosynthesis tyrosine autokinase [Phocaeicola vulgatus]MDC1738109.1 polysaccharide biosynthesis tyrosine autokinase [Phocaeicol
MAINQKNIKPGQQDDFLRIQDLLYLCLARWKWFVLSLMVTIGVATVYLLRTPAVYTRTASVLIKEDSKGKSVSSDLESFSEFGLFQSGTNVNNELITFQSPALMTEVVKRLRLDMNYFVPGKFHRQVAYGLTLPVDVTINDLPENESAGFTLKIQPDGTLYLSDFIRNGTDLDEKDVKGSLLDSITTPLGKIIIHTTPNYVKGEAYTLYVGKSSLYNAVNSCSSNLSVSLNGEKASVIDLSFKDNSTQRAEDVLSMLISVYNENWVKDKNQIAVSTSMFINERLGVIERELGNVDEDISSYKSEHLLPDVQAASSMYMAQSSEANAQILSLNNQLYMTRYIRNYLANDANRTQLLPANSGIESANIESQIAEYNKQLLQRNSLVANSSTENPLVVDMDQALASMRGAIIRSIDNQIVTLNSQIKSLRQTEQQTTSRIAANPTQAKYLLSVERQQKVKEALYLFLLQKREENELSQAFTAYNTRIVTPPHGSMLPTSPVHKNIFMVAFALGLLIPVVIIFMRENMNTRVRGRKDLENLTIPFIGEIPLFTRKKKGILGKKPQEVKAVVVKEGNRDIINEAFRVLRTNLEFMTGKDKTSNVIIMTSFNPGSGKSFLTMNIAMSLAIKGKKVLVIDGDLRHASASSYIDSPDKGLSDYLGGRIDNLDEIIVPDPKHKSMDILPVGTIPPNPTELLFDERLKQTIDTVREQYDYVLIDCPPVELVADTQIIEKLADRTIFVVRAGLLERSMLSELEKIYDEKKYKNMSLILNGTEGSGGRYGYCYGYRYGYGSGYHYGSDGKRGW